MKKVIVLGGDGFCGWPTSLFLSNHDYEIIIVDNLSRRKIDLELGTNSLTPISTIYERIDKWKEITGKKIKFHLFDVSEHYHRLLTLFKQEKPDIVIHFAEQRSAPYSMITSYEKRYTVDNNISATNNVLCAIVESEIDTHLVHLGTTGIYGYSTVNEPIPEGYLDIKVKDKDMQIVYPSNPGSIYHLTKCMDLEMFKYFNKNDKIRITDLEQGIVWGTQTNETKLDEKLINRFDYCSIYGTVLNRFLVQAINNHPLTVYGTGGQTRAFVNINDTVNCIKLAIENSPEKNDRVKILNQTTECQNVLELAKIVNKLTNAEIRFYENPRNEDSKNDLDFVNESFLNYGLNPITLNEGLLDEIMNIVEKYKHRFDEKNVPPINTWNKNMKLDRKGKKILDK